MTASTGPQQFGAPTMTAPAQDAFAITPSNSANFNIAARAIYVGVGGDITLVTPANNVVLFVAVPQGTVLPVTCIRINSTGTSASSLVGLI